MNNYSIVIPAYNESNAIGKVVNDLLVLGRKSGLNLEIVVVDDSSTDNTVQVVSKFSVRLVKNLQNFGYGFSIKNGIAHSSHENIIIIDADGSYPVNAIPGLAVIYEKGYDMVVGARQGKFYRGSFIKYPARLIFLWLAEFIAGRKIPDVNSGLRIFRKNIYQKYADTLCGTFSFTTTLTLAMLLNFNSVHYQPIDYYERIGKSKVRYIRDTLRTGQILVETILLYNPIKLYLLLSAGIILIGGVGVISSYFVNNFLVFIVFLTLTLSIVVFGLGLAVFRLSKK